MKNRYSKIILLIAFALIVSNLMAQKNKNYALYSLEETRFLCVSADEKSVFYLEQNADNKQVLIKRDLKTGKILRSFKTNISIFNISWARTNGKQLFLSNYKQVEDRRVGLLEGIYSVNLKNEKLEKIFTPKTELNQLAFMYLSENELIFSPYSREIEPIYLFDFRKKKLSELKMDKKYRVLFFAKERNSLVFVQPQESDKASDEQELYNLFLYNLSTKKITQIGNYQPDAVYSTNPEECKYPYAVVKTKDSTWFFKSQKANLYPAKITKLSTYPKLISAYQKLDGYEYFNMAYVVEEEYFIAFNLWLKQVSVYNIKTPQTVKKSNITKEQKQLIDAFVDERFSYIKTAIDSAVLDRVFDAKFYTIRQKVLDNWGSSWSDYKASALNGEFKIFNGTQDLLPLLKTGFVLKTQDDVLLFEKALDALYPLGVFAEKKKEHFFKDGKWFFVRDESFGTKKGVCVEVNDKGNVLKISKIKDFN